MSAGAPHSVASRSAAVLGQLRATALELLAQGKVAEAVELFCSALGEVLSKNRELELKLAKLARERVGKRSEQVDPHQLRLLFEELAELEQGEAAVDPEAEAREDAALTQEIEEAERANGGEQSPARRPRGVRVKEVERRVHQHEPPEEARVCERCGQPKRRIGEDVSRVLEWVPGHFVENEHHQAKYACPACKEGVTTAAGPAKIIERSAAGASLLADVVVRKYVDHCPLHRASRIYARCGVELPVSTLSDWVGEVADLLSPVVGVLGERILGAHVVGSDATGLKVLDPQSPENIERGTMWCYVGGGRDVLFRYAPTGEGQRGPWEFLSGRQGYVQADAASVFDRLFTGEVAEAIEVGCWAHARRRLIALQDTDCRVAYPLALIARLYRIEHLADARMLDPQGRAALRHERSQPVLEKLKRWLVIMQQQEPPATDLAKAVAYPLNHWQALTRFLHDGRLLLDNNVVEQQQRTIALGRKNYLFAGSHRAAARAAVLYSLMRTCAQHQVPPVPYLTDVLPKLAAGWPRDRLDELLPDRWLAVHGPGP